MNKYIIVGDSGHGKVIESIVKENDGYIIAKLDDKHTDMKIEQDIIKASIDYIYQLPLNEAKIIIAIGNNDVRKKIVTRLNLPTECYGTLVHPSSVISSTVKIGIGTVIMPNVVINAEAVIGDHVILNTGSIIEHDCTVSKYAHISPGSVLTGGVEVGEGTQIGAKSVVIPLVKIGSWSMIGAGSTVIKDIGDHVTAVGSPAKVIRKKDNE